MINQSFKRLLFLSVTLLLLTVVAFSIARLDVIAGWKELSFFKGLFKYINLLLHGDLGSNQFNQPIAPQILKLLPATIELCSFSFLLSLMIGVPLGTLSGFYQGKLLDKVISSVTLIVQSIPIFWGSIAFIILFSIQLDWLPTSGRINNYYHIPPVTGFIMFDIWKLDDPQRDEMLFSALRHLILPTLTLSILPTTFIIQTLRLSVSKIMHTNYIKAAMARGLSSMTIIRRHIIRNALPDLLPQFSVQLAQIITFAMIVENMYLWPGIGQWLLNMIHLRDYTSIQAGIILITLFILISNLIGELLIMLLVTNRSKSI